MVTKRRSHEEGHRRKFLVVVDDTPECDRAVVYASRRAARTGGGVVLLFIIDDSDFRGFLGVEQAMRAEAREAAEMTLAKVGERVKAIAGIEPDQVIREGTRSAEILAAIEADEDIAILALAAGTGSEGPGPLVTSIAGRASGTFPVPITIVPGHLGDDEIAAMA
ncbi:universal stress protein [Methyloraptor flagellatus]|jgi:nucleotide-binding universal stress UspA family protein|uniref:Universal stress protein n=2 Tax=Methyloraptor flagellatus TaxID=3162530 RepID=A0AAU7XAC7_9HYPH